MSRKIIQIKTTDIYSSLTLVGIVWFVFGLQSLGLFTHCYGVIPWRIEGIKGIFLSPLLHGNLNHIISNTLPLFILNTLLFVFYKRQAYTVLILGWLISGILLWLLPDFAYFKTGVYSCHIGASGLIYMLASYLFFSGIFLRDLILVIVSVVIAIIYGSLLYGIFPSLVDSGVSWQGHLIGVIVGLGLSYRLNKKAKRIKRL
ncbi:rhomboid family intramembrane serine protease [Myroides pelagicus]|uniref:rhomboid family intramembrane serine protease n=1 Tax=Myroides pelagicus TaxID=270914 RepID=UPI002DBD88CB|nr:rhomboid family intramembrane serine protease [Myroides pelagicus]MEC4115182.1 rhomboid family intramembrane serine protease [Myroides pelagicus]